MTKKRSGAVPEWLGGGLQNRLRWFNSNQHLSKINRIMETTSAVAHTNIALIKYWGKACFDKNIPETGSLSLTLDAFYTKTTISRSSRDRFVLNGVEQHSDRLSRVVSFLALVRPKKMFCEVISENFVPTESGLASSASGFAALACAANKFFKLEYSSRSLSKFACYGSGSAARSIFPGFVLMNSNGYARKINNKLDLNVVITECSTDKKKKDSRSAMNLTSSTSPYHSAWISSHSLDLKLAKNAVYCNDFNQLGLLTEHSTLKMHANLMASKPGFWYFEPLSLKIMSYVRELREQGLLGYFTLDAGPHVKIICESKNAKIWETELKKIPGVARITISKPGPGAYCE